LFFTLARNRNRSRDQDDDTMVGDLSSIQIFNNGIASPTEQDFEVTIKKQQEN
jgi:hypothetical protein